MKTILSLRRHHYLKTVSIFLIAVILIVGVVSCTGEGETYELTMAENPAAGGTATDETGGSPYTALTVVNIKAVPADCYRFVNWEATAGIFANSTAAETTFIMPARDVTVTANFELVPPDHFKLYVADWPGEVMPETLPVDVVLEDQFGTFNETVGEVELFGNPVKKVHAGMPVTPVSDWDRHYTVYQLEHDEDWIPSSFQVTAKNQFGDNQELTIWGPVALAVPTAKEDQEMSDCLDHLLLYSVLHPVEYVPEPIGIEVDLYDQFHDELGVTVYEPMLFANPVKKTRVDTSEVSEIQTDDHYVFYPIEEEFEKSGLPITNQFGDQTLNIGNAALLAVPSEKKDWEQPLDHFWGYWATWPFGWEPPPTFPAEVQLEDQFVTINATVYEPWLFANPVEKRKMVEEEEVVTPIWDPNNHLTWYWIAYEEEPQVWEVTVNNQFGNDQWLAVSGPWWLAVPTQKGDHDWPDVDHFLVYKVEDAGYYPAIVTLWDQFHPVPVMVNVGYAEYFAIPVQKTYKGEVTEIMNDEHLVWYKISCGSSYWEWLPIDNQFGPQILDVWEEEYDLLGVPSQKIEVSGPWPYEI